MRFWALLIGMFFSVHFVQATHIMGGEITWKCQGNQYVFELTIYRDCNQTNISTSQESLKVWNHPSTSTVPVYFVERVDISPACKPVAGSPPELSCGSGSFAGNGAGAIEKLVYRSNPVTLLGVPPANGWILTFDSFSRNASITNLVDPTNYGITITATIFKTQNSSCVDSSPQFLEDPFIIVCKGTPFTYNMNAFDPDIDSLVFSLGKPLNNIQNNTFNPPADPTELQFETNFSYLSPTPDASFDSQNQNFTINPLSGEVYFLSHTIGNFVIKVEITSYKNGEKWSVVQREFQVLVVNCLPDNNVPVITSSIPVNVPIDVVAGSGISINFTVTDNDLLQDGQPQTVTVSASGQMFGANYTSAAAGCTAPPCATLTETFPVSFNGTKNFSFNWQTSCDHLMNNGVMQNEKTYIFVIQAIDNYCQVPKFVYKTIQINVKNPEAGFLPEVECIQVMADGSYLLTFKNTGSISLPFYVRNQQNTVVATINSNTQTTVTIPPGNHTSFHIAYTSSCAGSGMLTAGPSAAVIDLVLQNPQNGTALLQWNAPAANMNSFGTHYYIYREYPAGNWILHDSVPVTTTVYRDTITICKAFINYQIGIQKGSCEYRSDIEGDTLKDKIAPLMPQLAGISIDTATGNALISWYANSETDTYGYIIYKTNSLGILYEIDTVYGRLDTTYTHVTNTKDGSVTYSISAFDSCYTETTPITFQTSAKSPLHTSVFVRNTYDPCSKIATLRWNDYIGWNKGVTYVVYKKTDNGWTEVAMLTGNTADISLKDDDEVSIFIKAINDKGIEVFSNILKLTKISSQLPAFHYTKTATVQGKNILIKHYIEVLPYMTDLVIERKDKNQFVEIGRAAITGTDVEYIDSAGIDVNKSSYTYRVLYLDSCGTPVNPANEVTTILARIIQADEATLTLNIDWSSYSIFAGGVTRYEVNRAVNDVYEWPPVYISASNQLNFEDQLNESLVMDGKVCYRVTAREGQNIYGFKEESLSNEACYVFKPLIYIPNAFTPGGLNPVFYPVINLAEINNYKLTIFDRWNNIIFVSDDIQTGWNGIMQNGMKAPFGVYGYQVSVLDGNGKEIRKTGHVTLIRSALE